MTRLLRLGYDLPLRAVLHSDGRGLVLMVKGTSEEALPSDMPGVEDFTFCTYAEVDRGLIERLQPGLVVSAILSPRFDALDLARRLVAADYGGRYRALTTPLPSPALVLAEIRAACPEIDFDLVTVEPRPAGRPH